MFGSQRSRKALFLKYPPVLRWMILVVRTGTTECSSNRNYLSGRTLLSRARGGLLTSTLTLRTNTALGSYARAASERSCLFPPRRGGLLVFSTFEKKNHGVWTRPARRLISRAQREAPGRPRCHLVPRLSGVWVQGPSLEGVGVSPQLPRLRLLSGEDGGHHASRLLSPSL